jgi:hypothetical protein
LKNLYERLDELDKLNNPKEKKYISQILSNKIKKLEKKIKIFKPQNTPQRQPGYANHLL